MKQRAHCWFRSWQVTVSVRCFNPPNKFVLASVEHSLPVRFCYTTVSLLLLSQCWTRWVVIETLFFTELWAQRLWHNKKVILPASFLAPRRHARFVSSGRRKCEDWLTAGDSETGVLKQDGLLLVLQVKLLHRNIPRRQKTFSFHTVNSHSSSFFSSCVKTPVQLCCDNSWRQTWTSSEIIRSLHRTKHFNLALLDDIRHFQKFTVDINKNCKCKTKRN